MELKEGVKVYVQVMNDWNEDTEENARQYLTEAGHNWVYDKEKNVICFFGMGGHVPAVRFIVRVFYGHKRINREDVPEWQRIIKENMILFGTKIHDPGHYVHYLPKTIK